MLLAPFYLTRALGIWVLCRLTAAMVGGLAGGDPLLLPARATILVVAVCVTLCMLDLARKRERALLANLGVSRTTVALWSAVPAVAGELAVALLGGPR